MTDPEFADRTYIEPMTVESLEQIIARERPDALLPTLGGQTALNLAIALAEAGVLERYGVELIGAQLDAIQQGRGPRALQARRCRRSASSCRAVGLRALGRGRAADRRARSGCPRSSGPSFTLGGTGGGIARTTRGVRRRSCSGRSTQSPNHELPGRGERARLEGVRARGDARPRRTTSSSSARSRTSTRWACTPATRSRSRRRRRSPTSEYQEMRDAAIAIIREIGVDTGGSNIQFAVDPDDGALVVIEMNPRVSRSLGARVEGDRLPDREDRREARGRLHARRDPERHHARDAGLLRADDRLRGDEDPALHVREVPAASTTRSTTQMKSVGEAMAIGRTFKESLQKALRSLEIGIAGLRAARARDGRRRGALAADRHAAARPALGDRARRSGAARRSRSSTAARRSTRGSCATSRRSSTWERELARGARARARGVAAAREAARLLRPAARRPLGHERGRRARARARARRAAGVQARRHLRRRVRGAHAVPLLDLRGRVRGAPDRPAQDRDPRRRAEPHRAGHRVRLLLRARGVRARARPASRRSWSTATRRRSRPTTTRPTGSTSSRSRSRTCSRSSSVEKPEGVIVQFGGQTPLKLAVALERAGVPILGTPPDAIDRAEDRERFEALLEQLGLERPPAGLARSVAEAVAVAARIGYPGAGAAVVRARRPRDGDRLRRGVAARVHGARGEGVARAPGPGRPLPRRRHRGRRRRDLRRRARRDRRHHGAHRAGRRPLGRQRVLAPAVLALEAT